MQVIYQAALPFDDVVTDVVCELPQLPSVLRYYDEFDDATRSILHPENSVAIDILAQGRRYVLDFSSQDSAHALLLKKVFAYLLGCDLSPLTVARYLDTARQIERHELEGLLTCGPKGIGHTWERLRSREFPTTHAFPTSAARMVK
ncbi:hypothetical protein [Chromobacterium haemolyticum]|uniref:hypothetical protein n=1 Tax=Chromobacterium haemolyticum TaxID=394935 RepID=UPI002447C2F7|nr:hypothetical protein [Chromobacterium haemolyticum]MDH0340251.1 hypothetical protein [Chromobacterium haemolyticum]